MREVFIIIMNMHIAASCMILITLGIRTIWKRAPHRLFLVLWGLVAVRLLCPVMLNSGFGLLPKIGTQNSARQEVDPDNTGIVIPVIQPGEAGESWPANEEHGSSASANPAGTKNSANNVPFSREIFIMIAWMIGAVAILTYTAADYLKVYRRLKDAQPFGSGQKVIYLSHNIETALLFGLIRPRIYLPADLEERDRAYVSRHEREHLKNGDQWWKLLSVLVLALHWFNPLVWAAFMAFGRDIEYACDEAVIQSLDRDGRRRYAHCLIDCSTINNHWGIVSLSFGKDVTKLRVKNIISYTRTKKGTLVVLGVIVCMIAVLFMTNRASANDEPGAVPKQEGQGDISYIDANGKDVRAYEKGTEAFGRLSTILEGDSMEFANLRAGYGGGYIADDGVLVVGFKNVSQEEIDAAKAAAQLEDVRFREVAYTCQELEQIEKDICEYLQGVYKVDLNTAKIYFTTAIDQETNCIKINLTAVDNVKLEAVKAELAKYPCTITVNEEIWRSLETK